MTDIFEKAAQLRLRFETPAGLITTEDLWDLPISGSARGAVSTLDAIGINLRRKIKEQGEESLVEKPRPDTSHSQLRFDIVKHIIDVRLAEKEAAEKRVVNRERRQKLLAALADKEQRELSEKSADEIRKLLAEEEAAENEAA